MKINDTLHGFRVVRRIEAEEIAAVGYEMVYEKNGAKLLWLDRDDVNKTFAITRDLLNEGIFVNPVVSPAVAPNDTLIRFSLMATHTHEQVSHALEIIQKVFRSYGLVP